MFTNGIVARSGARSFARAGIPGVCLALLWLAPAGSVAAETDSLPVHRMVVDGLHRTVRYYVPSRLADSPVLLIVLHGSGGDGERIRRFTAAAFDRAADRHGFVVAYPDALGGQWRDCRGRAPYQKALAGVDDVRFLAQLRDHAESQIGRRFMAAAVAGYSNGGHMVFRLAWEAPEHYTGFAAIGAHLPRSEERACTPGGTAVSMLLVSGTEDPINPWQGGAVRLPGSGSAGTVLSGEATAAYFRELVGLPELPMQRESTDDDSDDGTIVESRSWTGANGVAVTHLVVHGGGHTLPLRESAFPSEVVGRTSRELDAAEVIWQFVRSR